MRDRWQWIASLICAGAMTIAASAIIPYLVQPADTPPEPGDWVSTAAYGGVAPGELRLAVRLNGRVVVTGAPPGRVWWADRKHDLCFRGDRLEVWAGNRVVGELLFRHRAGML